MTDKKAQSPLHVAAAWYHDHGLALIAWDNPEQKYPLQKDWGLTAADPAKLNGAKMIGVNHALSRTVSLDIDDVDKARPILKGLGIDIDNLPEDVPVCVGNPERLKLFYRCPPDWVPPGVKQLQGPDKHIVLEFRGGPPGSQVQCCLPPSPYPGSDHTYNWRNKPLPPNQWPELPWLLTDVWSNWKAHLPAMKAKLGWPAPADTPTTNLSTEPDATIQAFNECYLPTEILQRNGYTYHSKKDKWLSPYSTSKNPGVKIFTDDPRGKITLYSHHGSDPLAASDSDHHALDAFDCFRLLEHDGDAAAALTALQDDEDVMLLAAQLLFKDVPAIDVEALPLVPEVLPPSQAAALPPASLVTDLAEHFLAASTVPQPAFALSAALSAVAMVTGNLFAVDVWHTRLNLYTLNVGPTGSGKDQIARSVVQALTAAGQEHLATSGVASGPALLRTLNDRRALFLWEDECWSMMSAVNAGNDSHQLSKAKELMALFSAAGAIHTGRTYADTKQNIEPIHHPFLNVALATTGERLMQSLQLTQVVDGFLNRFLVFKVPTVGQRRPPTHTALPQHLVERLALLQAAPLGPDGYELQCPEEPTLLPLDAEAMDEQQRFLTHVEKRMDGPLGALWSRAHENSLKVAGLVAVGTPGRGITGPIMRWATDLLHETTTTLTGDLEANLTESVMDAKLKRVLGIIADPTKAAGDQRYAKYIQRGLMPHGKVLMQSRLDAREFKAVIGTLIEAEQVEMVTAKSGKQTVKLYRLKEA